VQTSTAGTWTTLAPAGIPRSTSSATGKLDVIVGAVGMTLLEADGLVFAGSTPKPKLVVRPDDLSSLYAATATVSGNAPVSVAFAYRRVGAHAWHRIDVDTSPPFRGFVDPARFARHELLQVIAIARGLDGSIAPSPVVPFTVP
jgi:hypothetical protein